jgi:hypothetical protein
MPNVAFSMLDHDRFRDSLVNAGAIVAAAELHGGVCGALCSGGPRAAERWLEDCLEDQELGASSAEAADIAAELRELVAASWEMLTAGQLEFQPLLPSDDAPLAEQAQALALWCHGFLGGVAGGVGRGGAPLEEILGDFAEISRAGLSEAEAAGTDQPDFALAQIQEYVRVGVQLVFEELAAQRAAATPDSH